MRDGNRRTVIALAATMLCLSTLAGLGTPAQGASDDEPVEGRWAEDGSVFRDMVRLSADDPSADPVDWYRVNLTAGATELDLLTIRVNLTRDGGAQFLVWAAIHYVDGGLMQEVRATTYAVKTASVLCHRSGVYLVQVYTYSYLECHYRLEFDITRVANVTDGDDTIEEATFLEPPADVTGHLHGILDTFDHYAVNLTRDETWYEFLEVRLEPSGTPVGQHDLDLFLIVLDHRGIPREVSSSTSNASREVTNFAASLENTTVYIRCHAYGGDLDYRLNVTVYRVVDDGNNNIVRATQLEMGVPRNDTINLTDPLDYFRFDLEGGDIAWLFLTAHDYDPVARKPDLNLYLYSPDGRIINWSHSYDPLERVGLEVPVGDPSATYYALVTSFDRNPGDGIPAWGAYTLNLTVDHAPRIIADIPLVVEEDGQLRVPIASLVEDPEGSLLSAVPGSGSDVTAHEEDGDVVIVPAANFSGLTSFYMVATDDLRTVRVPVPLNVTPVPDWPALVDPAPVLAMDEDGELVVDLTDLIVDGDGEELVYELVPAGPGPLGASTLVGTALTLVPAADFFGDGVVEVNATDGDGHTSTLAIPVSVNPVQDPPRVLQDSPIATALEDQRGTEVDLATIFGDVDGDALSYAIDPADHVLFIVLGDLLRVDPEEDWNGQVVLHITARDPTGAEASVDLTLEFLPVDDPPRLVSVDPVDGAELTEGEAATFTVTARDVEGKALSYAWYLDGSRIDGEALPRFELVTNFSSQGDHLLTAVASDGTMETWFNWTVRVENVNRPPAISVRRPEKGDTFPEGDNVVLEALTSDPDGETLSVQWIEKGEVIGTGFAFTSSAFKPGKHTVTARVVDPHGASAEANVTFEVEEAGGLPGPSATAAAVVMTVAALASVAWRRRRA